MNLGGVSSDYANQAFTNLPLYNSSFVGWNVPLEDALFGSFNVNTANNNYAYIDTSSNLIMLSQADYNTFITNISYVPDMVCGAGNCGGKLGCNFNC